jgi:hypothetical protein
MSNLVTASVAVLKETTLEFSKELEKLEVPSVEAARQILEPNSNLKRAARLMKKADELHRDIQNYFTPPCLAEKPIKKKPAA